MFKAYWDDVEVRRTVESKGRSTALCRSYAVTLWWILLKSLLMSTIQSKIESVRWLSNVGKRATSFCFGVGFVIPKEGKREGSRETDRDQTRPTDHRGGERERERENQRDLGV